MVHRHHNLSEDERIVWEINDDVWIAKPKNESDIIPVNWKVDYSQGSARIYPLEFCVSDNNHEIETSISNRILSNKDFLAEFIRLSVKLDACDVFGIGILQTRSLFTRPDYTMFEQSDLSKRTTKAWSIPKSNLSDENKGVTLWNFTKYGGVNSVRDCSSGNSRHCCDNAVGLH